MCHVERVGYLPDDLVTILSEHVATHLDDADPARWLPTVDDAPIYDDATSWRWRATRTAAKLTHRAPRAPAVPPSGLWTADCGLRTGRP
jgi:hypothetical protein